jgi:DNA polymerase-3 subunit epsilon
MREIVLDTETTGLSPSEGDRIVEIACLELIDRKPTGKYFQSYVNPERRSHPIARRIHGLSSAFLKTQPKFHEIVDDLMEFIGDADLAIHNAAFT